MPDLPVPYEPNVPDPYMDDLALRAGETREGGEYGRAPGARMPAYAADKVLAPCLVAGVVRDQLDIDAPHEFYDPLADKYVSFPRGPNPETLFERRQAIASAREDGETHRHEGRFDPDSFVAVHAFKALVGDWDIGFNIIVDDAGCFYGIDHEWAGDYASHKHPDRVVRHFRGCAEQLDFDGEQPGMDDLGARVADYARQVDLDVFHADVEDDPHIPEDVFAGRGIGARIHDAIAEEQGRPEAILDGYVPPG